EEAILREEETHLDLVLMDIVLRGQTDGVQAAHELQSRLGIPVVYLTAYFDDATLERAKATEPFGYIIKPFKDINLRTSIEIALRRHEAEKTWVVARHAVESPVQYSVTPVTDKEGNNGDAVSFFEAIDAVQVGETQRAEPLGVSETLVPTRPLSVVELKLAERMGLLEALVQNSPLATVVLDPQQRVLICNPVFGDLFLYQRQEILGHKLGELIKDYVTGTDTIEVSPSVLSGQVLHTTQAGRTHQGLRHRHRHDRGQPECFVWPGSAHHWPQMPERRHTRGCGDLRRARIRERGIGRSLCRLSGHYRAQACRGSASARQRRAQGLVAGAREAL